MTISASFPDSWNSLNLDFANLKRLDPRITFTRASDATYVDENGIIQTATTNVPRFTHDSVTGKSLGLLVEEARTNLLLRSEEFDSGWTLNGMRAFGSGSTANATTAPDGTTTADLLTEDTSTGVHNVVQTASGTSGTTYTFSVFVKVNTGGRNLRLFVPTAIFGDSGGNATFNLTTFAGAGFTGTVASQFIQAYPNGWYRLGVVTTAATADATGDFTIGLVSDTTASYTGDDTSGVFLWGAQLEAGAFPTSYIKTEGSTATRATDIATITGTSFSQWYRQDEGAIYHAYRPFGSDASRIYSADDGTADNLIRAIASNASESASNYINITTAGSSQGSLGALDAYSATPQRGALAYAVNNCSYSKNGGAVFVDTSVTLPVVNKLTIGAEVNGITQLNGTISRLTFWPRRLSDSILQEIAR
jgi:hypothetical protein